MAIFTRNNLITFDHNLSDSCRKFWLILGPVAFLTKPIDSLKVSCDCSFQKKEVGEFLTRFQPYPTFDIVFSTFQE